MKQLIVAVIGLAFVTGVVVAQTPMTKDSMNQEDKNAPMGKDRAPMPKGATKGMQKGSDMPKDEMQKKK